MMKRFCVVVILLIGCTTPSLAPHMHMPGPFPDNPEWLIADYFEKKYGPEYLLELQIVCPPMGVRWVGTDDGGYQGLLFWYLIVSYRSRNASGGYDGYEEHILVRDSKVVYCSDKGPPVALTPI